jgi:hypothetical protein
MQFKGKKTDHKDVDFKCHIEAREVSNVFCCTYIHVQERQAAPMTDRKKETEILGNIERETNRDTESNLMVGKNEEKQREKKGARKREGERKKERGRDMARRTAIICE